jgi:hypothetical protein
MATRKSYKKADLDKYVEENEIELIGEYENVHVHTTIKGKCKSGECEDIFDKRFTSIINGGGPYCIKCCNIKKDIKTKKTCLEKYGVNNPGNSNEAKEKSKKTCLEKYGVEHTTQSKNMKEKSMITCIERYGVENGAQSIEAKEKSKETCKKKYGVEYYFQTNDKKEKSKETCRKKYGVEYPAQSIEVKEKSKETCLEKYGVEYTLQSGEVRVKGKQTKLEKYGCETCKINLVYGLFTNLDCERICSDCSNPERNPKYQKTKEWLVVRKLREDLPDIPFIHNKSVGNECTLQDRDDTNGHLYPDIRFELFGFDLIVEVDENRHRGADYSCDERRMYDIVAKLRVPCVFIRYNPDDKTSDYNVLLEMIKEYLEKDIDEINFDEDINGHKNIGLKTEYLFY